MISKKIIAIIIVLIVVYFSYTYSSTENFEQSDDFVDNCKKTSGTIGFVDGDRICSLDCSKTNSCPIPKECDEIGNFANNKCIINEKKLSCSMQSGKIIDGKCVNPREECEKKRGKYYYGNCYLLDDINKIKLSCFTTTDLPSSVQNNLKKYPDVKNIAKNGIKFDEKSIKCIFPVNDNKFDTYKSIIDCKKKKLQHIQFDDNGISCEQ